MVLSWSLGFLRTLYRPFALINHIILFKNLTFIEYLLCARQCAKHSSDWESEATSLNGRARVWDGVQLSLLTAKGVDEMRQGCWARD